MLHPWYNVYRIWTMGREASKYILMLIIKVLLDVLIVEASFGHFLSGWKNIFFPIIEPLRDTSTMLLLFILAIQILYLNSLTKTCPHKNSTSWIPFVARTNSMKELVDHSVTRIKIVFVSLRSCMPCSLIKIADFV